MLLTLGTHFYDQHQHKARTRARLGSAYLGPAWLGSRPEAQHYCQEKESYPKICGTENTSGTTALHFACMRGDWDILTLLLNLEAGASYDAEDNSKKLPRVLRFREGDFGNIRSLPCCFEVAGGHSRKRVRTGLSCSPPYFAIYFQTWQYLWCHSRRRSQLLQRVSRRPWYYRENSSTSQDSGCEAGTNCPSPRIWMDSVTRGSNQPETSHWHRWSHTVSIDYRS